MALRASGVRVHVGDDTGYVKWCQGAMSAKCGHRLLIVNGYDSTAIDRFSANPNYPQTGCRTNQDGHNQVHARCANCQSILPVKVPSAGQHGLTAATDSAPKTTSTIAITAHTKPTLTKKLAKSDEESNPLTNVVREKRPCRSRSAVAALRHPTRIPLPPLTSRRQASSRRRRKRSRPSPARPPVSRARLPARHRADAGKS